MTLTEMRYVVALARERHFGKAADACHVSQPTLSVALKKVEGQIGAPLFERGTNDIRITPLGERIVEQARRVLAEAVKLEEIAEATGDPMTGQLRVGIIYTIAPYLLPQLIPALSREAPKMPLFLKEDFTGNLIPALKAGELDVIVIALPFSEPGLVAQPVYDEPFRVLMPAEHPWTTFDRIPAAKLAEENVLLLGAGNCFRDQVLEVCPQCVSNSPLQEALAGSSLETIRYMVASGLGVTVLPSSAADDASRMNPLLAVRPFAEPEPYRRVVLVWRVTYPRHGAIDVLRRAIFAADLPGVRPVGPAPRRLPEEQSPVEAAS